MNGYQPNYLNRFLQTLMNGRVFPISLLLVVILCSSQTASACLNPIEIGRNEVGKQIQLNGLSTEEFLTELLTHEGKKYWAETLKELQKQQKDTPSAFYPNNIAVAMVHLGQIKQAIKILEMYEKDEPGIYQTAANLGTAYELDGQNEKALKWIKEGVKRNGEGHCGSEWLHVKILEAKIALDIDPDWLKKRSVLGIDLTQPNLEITISDTPNAKRSIGDIEAALVYQLHERLEFVKPQEAVVADLLYDLARVFTITRSAEHSAAVKALALSYGPANDRTPPTTHSEKETIGLDKAPANYRLIVAVGLVGLFVFILTSVLILRKKFFSNG